MCKMLGSVDTSLYSDQDPCWYPSVASRQEEEEGGSGGGIKREASTESSSPDVQCPPPRKKRKLSGSGASYLQVKTVQLFTLQL